MAANRNVNMRKITGAANDGASYVKRSPKGYGTGERTYPGDACPATHAPSPGARGRVMLPNSGTASKPKGA